VDSLTLEALAVVKECGNLPFALALSGAMVRDGISWSDLLDALEESDFEFIEKRLPNYPYPNILESLKIGVDFLARADPVAAKHYHELSVFSANQSIPEAAVLTLWLRKGELQEREARKILAELRRKALLNLDGTAPQRFILMHDLQRDYLRAVSEDLKVLHQSLLYAYWQQCRGAWYNGPDDGYFFQNLPHHLIEAGREEELRELLLDLNWLQAKLEATDVNALIRDYSLLISMSTLPYQSSKSSIQTGENLRLVQDAIRLSSHVLSRDKTQLVSQLMVRLISSNSLEIQKMMKQAKGYGGTTWLRPLASSLTPPGGSLVRTLEGHTSVVNSVAVTSDGRYIISGSVEGILKTWDLETGEEIRTLKGHNGSVLAVAVTSDGRYAISGSVDKTLKVWDLETGEDTKTLRGHGDNVRSLAVTSDGRYAISGSGDSTLRVWDLESGEEIKVFERYSSRSVAVTSDGRYAVCGSGDTIMRILDLETGKEIKSLWEYEVSVLERV
jgi:hypothetical protein